MDYGALLQPKRWRWTVRQCSGDRPLFIRPAEHFLSAVNGFVAIRHVVSLSACTWYSLPHGFIAGFVLYVSGMLGKHESRLHQASVYRCVFPVGVQVETVISEIVFFVSSTCVITLVHMKKLNEITLVGNTGHFDNEFDFAGSGRSNSSRRSVNVLGTGFAGIS